MATKRSSNGRKKSGERKYSKGAERKIHEVMKEKKKGTLKSSSGKKVTSRKQAIAIGISEARRAGKKVPKKPTSKRRKTSSRKRSS